jgi:hypothetical protein
MAACAVAKVVRVPRIAYSPSLVTRPAAWYDHCAVLGCGLFCVQRQRTISREIFTELDKAGVGVLRLDDVLKDMPSSLADFVTKSDLTNMCLRVCFSRKCTTALLAALLTCADRAL